MHSHWWDGVESNHRSRFFRPARQPCTPPSHVQGTNLFCKMLDLNQLPIVYQTIALPYELISLQKLIAVRAFKQKRKENHYDSWLRGVGLEPPIFSLLG